MSVLEQALRSLIADEVAAAEKRILERVSVANDRTLSFSEACDYLNMSEYTLRRLCREKRIPHRLVGKEDSKRPIYLFSTVSLDKWKKDEEQRNYILASLIAESS